MKQTVTDPLKTVMSIKQTYAFVLEILNDFSIQNIQVIWLNFYQNIKMITQKFIVKPLTKEQQITSL